MSAVLRTPAVSARRPTNGKTKTVMINKLPIMAKSDFDQPPAAMRLGASVLVTVPASDCPVASPRVAASRGRQLPDSSPR